MSEVQNLLPSPEELKRIRKRVRDRNYRFKKMKPHRQRMAIARDVIKSLNEGRMVAAQMGYFNIGVPKGTGFEFRTPAGSKKRVENFKRLLDLAGDDWGDGNKEAADVSLNEAIAGVPCTVCGIAACFVAAVDKIDDITLGEADGMSDNAMRDYLCRWFSKEQVRLIEAAFERDFSFAYHHVESGDRGEVSDAAEAFGRQHVDPKERLIAIMKNIIDNEGTFRPQRP